MPPSRIDSPSTTVSSRRHFVARLVAVGTSALVTNAVAGCDVREFARRHGGKLRLAFATGPVAGIYYVYGAAIARLIDRHVPNVQVTAEVTSASVENLTLLAKGQADLALTVGPALDEAYRGRGAFARLGRAPVRVLAALYANLTHVVTLAGSGITALGDLRGHVVSVGPPGSGTEDIALRILRAIGIDPGTDIRRHGLSPAAAADALRDGKLDAFIWNSGVPLAPIVDLASGPRHRIRLIPSAEVVPALQREYGGPLVFVATIPKGAYPGLTTAIPTLATANLLVADAAMGDELAYQIVQALFDHTAELLAVHPAAKELKLDAAVAPAPAPFHPGAIRFYRERGVWPD